MSSLKERMEEFAKETGWDVGRIATEAGVTSSAVSQWFGKGSKIINSIGIAPATKLENATGYRAMWLSKGQLPKLVSIRSATTSDNLSGSVGIRIPSELPDIGPAVETIAQAIGRMSEQERAQLTGKLTSLVHAPDSPILKKSISESLGTLPPAKADGASAPSPRDTGEFFQ